MNFRQAKIEDNYIIYNIFGTLNQQFVDYFTRKRVKEIIRKRCVSVAVNSENKIVGACAINLSGNHGLEIFAIATNPLWKGIGIGSKFLRWAEVMAQMHDRSFVFAKSYGFYNATPFYEKNGYLRHGIGNYTFTKWV